MWKFRWGAVGRHSIAMLTLVGYCDLSTIFMNIFVGDLPSMVIKNFVSSLRIRLEVNVLFSMVDYLKSKRGNGQGAVVSGMEGSSPNTLETSGRSSWWAFKFRTSWSQNKRTMQDESCTSHTSRSGPEDAISSSAEVEYTA